MGYVLKDLRQGVSSANALSHHQTGKRRHWLLFCVSNFAVQHVRLSDTAAYGVAYARTNAFSDLGAYFCADSCAD